MMKKISIHHVGYLVKDIKKAATVFEEMGFQKNGGVYDPVQKADIMFLYLNDICVELVAPNKESEIYSLLRRYRNTPYHICYEVENLDQEIKRLMRKGYVLFRSPVPAIAISEDAQVAFLMNRHIGMVELVEL